MYESNNECSVNMSSYQLTELVIKQIMIYLIKKKFQ